MSIELVMPSNHLILCHTLLLLPSIFPSIRVFSNDQLFASGGQSTGVSASASVLPMNIQDWFPLGLTGFIPLQSKELLVKLPGFWFDCFLLVYCILFFGCVVLIIFSRNVKKHNVFHKMFVFPLSECNQLDIFIFTGVLGVLFNQWPICLLKVRQAVHVTGVICNSVLGSYFKYCGCSTGI